MVLRRNLPMGPMGAVYSQLSITERRWRHAKVPVDEMARVLKRCRSTIFRELKRNHFSDKSMPKHDGYYGAAAQLMSADRRARLIIGSMNWLARGVTRSAPPITLSFGAKPDELSEGMGKPQAVSNRQ